VELPTAPCDDAMIRGCTAESSDCAVGSTGLCLSCPGSCRPGIMGLVCIWQRHGELAGNIGFGAKSATDQDINL
jgi:hypothetical protein